MTAAAGAGGEPAPGQFPWDTVMAVGFGLLRLSSRDFWAMTPREFERAMSFYRLAVEAGPGRGDLAALMAAFPDKRRT
ncbi:rcc01693 family protein [Mesorhizobium sp. CN2-181]|uniref:rcc01693 family protein n=1 Tax=Mesorhizobium yinganensis TaxID=3157707 RepID=UPI0032B78AC3